MAVVRSLVRGPFRLRNITVPPAPVLSVRTVPLLCWRRYSTPAAKQAVKRNNGTAQANSKEYIDFEDNVWDMNDIASAKKRIKGVSFGQDSISLSLDSNGRSESYEISYIRLRDGCKCPLCVDKYSKQRNFRSSDIPVDISTKACTWDGATLSLTWNKDVPGFKSDHITKYNAADLYYPWDLQWHSFHSTGPERRRQNWEGPEMKQLQHWISYNDYMYDDEKFTVAMRNLSSLGLVFVKDIPDSREMVEKIAARMGPLRNSFYGSTWDVRTVPEAKNVAYTNQFLGFHMDLMYMKDPPGFQLLHCLRNSCDGGESLFADTFKVAAYVRHHDPELFNKLKNTYITYEYQHKEQSYQNTWPVFEASPNVNPHNSVTHVNYSPPFQGLSTPKPSLPPSITREREEIQALQDFVNRLERPRNIFELKLKPGECVIFENRRVVHARRRFNTTRGERWLAGAYVDEDAVLSRFQVCKETYPRAWRSLTRRVPYWDSNPSIDPRATANPETSEMVANLMKQLLEKDAKK
ncbi:hypothetical protein BJY01DRAFT_6731 [Aspergillus pseudoustus]|uniref:TauD/TfdA-like domain-containing protein n=1 Tax=Aspergillus pseudoustus TaxID=1810923 RepID=A0ABR4JPF1_9EURO